MFYVFFVLVLGVGLNVLFVLFDSIGIFVFGVGVGVYVVFCFVLKFVIFVILLISLFLWLSDGSIVGKESFILLFIVVSLFGY